MGNYKEYAKVMQDLDHQPYHQGVRWILILRFDLVLPLVSTKKGFRGL